MSDVVTVPSLIEVASLSISSWWALISLTLICRPIVGASLGYSLGVACNEDPLVVQIPNTGSKTKTE